MQINLSEFVQHIGELRTVLAMLEFDAVTMAGETYPVRERQPAKLELTGLDGRKIALRAEAELTLAMPCARCLEEVQVPFSVAVDTQLTLPDTPEGKSEDSDEPYLDGYQLDVDALICNELYMRIPIRVLCREDCRGLCPRCGANLNFGECGCDRTDRDPRMAAILDIFQQAGDRRK